MLTVTVRTVAIEHIASILYSFRRRLLYFLCVGVDDERVNNRPSCYQPLEHRAFAQSSLFMNSLQRSQLVSRSKETIHLDIALPHSIRDGRSPHRTYSATASADTLLCLLCSFLDCPGTPLGEYTANDAFP